MLIKGLLQYTTSSHSICQYINTNYKQIILFYMNLCSGYMPPEYMMKGLFSTKSDIYSFGILMLEIVSGRRNNSFYNADNPINLVGHVSQNVTVFFTVNIFSLSYPLCHLVFEMKHWSYIRLGSCGKLMQQQH